jgi:hypothetical protein
MIRGSLHLPICAALAAAAVFALSACGDEGADELTFELNGSGKSAKFTAPESAESGEAEITFTNNTDKDAEVQLLRIEGDHSAEEVLKALGDAQSGKPFPDWFFAGGGVSTTKPGESRTATQVLEPGTYYAVNTESESLSPEGLASTEVTGDQSDDEVDADTTVTAAEYAFTADGLTAGENEIAFKNDGAQPHHLLISPLKGDATAEEVEEAFKSEKGPPPLGDETLSTAVIEGGEGQLVSIDLKPGRYAFYCFISDRQGGPPHALKGMVDEFEVD